MERFITANLTPVETDRFLTTILFAETVKSQGPVASEDATPTLSKYQALIDVELQKFKAVEVERAGNRLVARFDGPGRAIRCAVGLRNAAAKLSIDLRSGVHTGECELIGDKLSGIAVSIGAAIMTKARPGEVLISSTVRDLVAGSGFEFCDRGAHEFAGIGSRWHLFGVLTS